MEFLLRLAEELSVKDLCRSRLVLLNGTLLPFGRGLPMLFMEEVLIRVF